MERRLGRGLGSLLGGSIAGKTGAELERSEESAQREVAIGDIQPNPHQPRKVFDPEGLQELRDSIRQHGVLQPIVLRAAASGFEIIAGERRWRASRLAGLDHVPAIVRDEVSDDAMLELALVENVQRRDLNAIEKARGFQLMMDQLSLTQAEVSHKVGLKRATVANHLRLLELPATVQEAVSAGLLSMGHGRALAGLSSGAAQEELMGEIVRSGLSVRQTESKIQGPAPKAAGTSPSHVAGGAKPKSADTPEEPWVTELQRRIQIAQGTKVVIQNQDGFRGKIVLEYYGREDLDRLIEVLAPQDSI
ncbi:MAG: ParB family chromosome partitioning protein [Gammaproteobacteria bacterium]|jgi:ParB family chromosome partitioning protein